MTERQMINYTPALRDKLRKAYSHAVEQGRDEFEFEGRQYLTSYARYLLEFLDTQFGRQ